MPGDYSDRLPISECVPNLFSCPISSRCQHITIVTLSSRSLFCGTAYPFSPRMVRCLVTNCCLLLNNAEKKFLSGMGGRAHTIDS